MPLHNVKKFLHWEKKVAWHIPNDYGIYMHAGLKRLFKNKDILTKELVRKHL